MGNAEKLLHEYALMCQHAAIVEMSKGNYELAHVLINRFDAYNAFEEMELERNMCEACKKGA